MKITKQERIDLYRDMLYVDLGPFARMTPQENLLGVVKRWLFGLGYKGKTILDFIRFGKKTVIGAENLKSKIWLLAGSKNNRDSLAFLENGLKDSLFVALNEDTRDLDNYTRISFHRALLDWYRFPWLMWKLHAIYGKMLWQRVDHLIKAIGMERVAWQVLSKYQPKALVFTNDHGPKNRALLWASKQMGIPSVFIQHASVSKYFPPLKFDLNLLEGEESLRNYQACGPIEGQVEMIGMPKFDGFFKQRNVSEKIQRIGLCANIFDQTDRLTEVLAQVSQAFPDCQLSFRLHPRDQRQFELPGTVQLSDSKKEGIFEFLQSQDLIIAGDTSTHLEAILLNVSSLYFRFNDSFYDYYGYLRNGLVEEVKTVEALIQMIAFIKEKRPSVFQKAQPYNAVVGTPNDGKSSGLAIQYIKDFLI